MTLVSSTSLRELARVRLILLFADDVYTTIPDPNNPIYNSESETYARIPPLPITVEAEINVPPSERINDERLVQYKNL